MLGCGLSVLLAAGLVLAMTYRWTGEFRERRAILQPLLATNASLSNVVARAGDFIVTRKTKPEWTRMLGRYKTGSQWDRHIAGKMEHSSAVGHTSTMYMQTWIFLDDNDRLIDFELGTQ